MDIIRDLYAQGLTYDQYLDKGTENERADHRFLLEEVRIDASCRDFIDGISHSVQLLVFCNIQCNDCRITLAVLEKLRQTNSLLDFRIVDREGHRLTMNALFGAERIPMVIQLKQDKVRMIYNEFPEALKEILDGRTELQRKQIILKYRKGQYNDMILEQLIRGVMQAM